MGGNVRDAAKKEPGRMSRALSDADRQEAIQNLASIIRSVSAHGHRSGELDFARLQRAIGNRAEVPGRLAAEKLGISYNTLKAHLKRILAKTASRVSPTSRDRSSERNVS